MRRYEHVLMLMNRGLRRAAAAGGVKKKRGVGGKSVARGLMLRAYGQPFLPAKTSGGCSVLRSRGNFADDNNRIRAKSFRSRNKFRERGFMHNRETRAGIAQVVGVIGFARHRIHRHSHGTNCDNSEKCGHKFH